MIFCAALPLVCQVVVQAPAGLYNEPYRPQFHFTAKKGWLNDPNGLLYYDGEYHLFFQYHPLREADYLKWWGHAVSRDLVHWEEIAPAIEARDKIGIWSGSAVVDWNNTSGLRTGEQKTLVAFYTGALMAAHPGEVNPFMQYMVYSNDRGRTWTAYDKKTVLGHVRSENRDPKVFWYAPGKTWIMTIYIDGNEYQFFSSPDLKQWTYLSSLTVPGCAECPDIFEMRVEGNKESSKWVFVGGNGHYMIGSFDGKKFTPETGPFQADFGGNYYATQTFNDIPRKDGRRIQLAWMYWVNGSEYPGMPFTQQMNFPCELTLRAFPEGLRICRVPVREISALRKSEHKWKSRILKPGDNLLSGISGELFDIRAEIELKDATEFGLRCRGEAISYSVKDRKLTCLGKSIDLEPSNGRIKLQVLLDRTSLEVFGNDGRVVMSSCFLPSAENKSLEIYANSGSVRVVSLSAYELKSAWTKAETK